MMHLPAPSTAVAAEAPSPAPSRGAHLMMRYHVPLDDFDRYLDSVLDLCDEANIAEVIFLIDPEEHFTGLPSLARLRQWTAALKVAGELLLRRAILMSINPWVTLGHGGRIFPPADELKLTARMTGDDGQQSIDTACPADPAWQRYIAQAYAILAAAGPNILWIEDDFRLHNHGNVRFGCFAPPMLDAFERRTGVRWQRADLVEAIVANMHVRAQWLTFTGELWNQNVARIRAAVDRVNPDVRLAQMTSSMSAHAVEGRRWREYFSAMSGPHRPIARPHFGPYRNATGFDFVEGLVLFRHSLAFAGRGTRCCAEIENWPYSYFSKSTRQTRAAFELSQLFGCADVTFNLFSLAGNDPADEPWVAQTLCDARPRLDALAACGLERRIERGVHLWTDERAALHQRASESRAGMAVLQPAFDAWGRALARMGVASTFETRGALTAVCGDTIRAADNTEVRRILSGGVMLDGRAAMALQDMGYAEHLGVVISPARCPSLRRPITIERIVDFEFGPRFSPVMPCGMMGVNFSECRIHDIELCGARAASRFHGADGADLGPAVSIFENALGGRVAVFSYDFDSGVADSVRFFSHSRKLQIQSTLRWLDRGGGTTIACADAAMIVVESCGVDEHELLALINLSGDTIEAAAVALPAPPRNACMLDPAGRWRAATWQRQHDGQTRFVFSTPLESFEASFLRWERQDL